MKRSLIGIAVGVFALSADVHAQEGGVMIGATISRVVPGELSASKLALIAPQVATIAPDSAEIRLHVGDTLSLASVVLIARDSSGTEIGRFRTFDSTLRPGASLVPAGVRRFVATAEGPSEFILAFPMRLWVGRTDPPASTVLKVLVVP